MGEYLEFLVYFLILLLPLIARAVAGARGKADPTASRSPAEPRPAPRRTPAEVEGAERWKRLLRGEEGEQPPAPTPDLIPDPMPRAAREPAAPPVEALPPRKTTPPAAPQPQPASRIPRRVPRPSVAEQRTPTIRFPAAPLGELTPGLGARRRLDVELAASLDELAGPSVVSSLESADMPSLAGSFAFPPQSAADWRRAIALQEILGPPLALREGPRPGDLPSFSII